jgi:hypothetical protein
MLSPLETQTSNKLSRYFFLFIIGINLFILINVIQWIDTKTSRVESPINKFQFNLYLKFQLKVIHLRGKARMFSKKISISLPNNNKTMRCGVVLLVVLVSLVGCMVGESSAQTEYCTGTPNNNPIVTNPPTLVTEVPNGKLYVQGLKLKLK